MPAYVVVEIDVTDPETCERYKTIARLVVLARVRARQGAPPIPCRHRDDPGGRDVSNAASVLMRRTAILLWTLGLAAACGQSTGPSSPRSVYALARVGVDHLPVALNPDSPLPLLLADTLRLVLDRSRSDQQILQQTTVIQDGPGGKIGRSDAEFLYRIQEDALIYDNCPVGSVCLANLVYAPRILRIVGDSLFQVTPLGANIPPRVYGLVR